MLTLNMAKTGLRLIEAGFPCHQIGAETQRERDTGQSPPTHRLHVWWARRPLTPSRAAILASILPADTKPDWFLRQLGIEKVQAQVNGQIWTLTGQVLEKICLDSSGNAYLTVDNAVLRELQKEQDRRRNNLEIINSLRIDIVGLEQTSVLDRWEKENQIIPLPFPQIDDRLIVTHGVGDPDWAGQRIDWENDHGIRSKEDKYGYPRAFKNTKDTFARNNNELIVLDPMAGGGSIPFEALRLG